MIEVLRIAVSLRETSVYPPSCNYWRKEFMKTDIVVTSSGMGQFIQICMPRSPLKLGV